MATRSHRFSSPGVTFLLLVVCCLAACNLTPPASPAPSPQATQTFTPVVTMVAPSPTLAPVPTRPSTPTPMPQWQPLGAGVEFLQRLERVGDVQDWVLLARIQPTATSLRVHYAPDAPRRVRQWAEDTRADVVINAGFFTADMRATGLVIADGQHYGQTYRGFGGMFSLRDGQPALQWLARQPYVADPSISQGVQSFPMLLLDGQIVPGIPDDGSRNRRSFIGIDRAGRVVVGVCQSPVWTMADLAGLLASSELIGLDRAVNLDGGASSGLWIRGVSEAMLPDSIEEVPSVIAVTSN